MRLENRSVRHQAQPEIYLDKAGGLGLAGSEEIFTVVFSIFYNIML